MKKCKVEVSKVREFLLKNGGFSDVDERNLQEDAELIREEKGCAVIQFHRQKSFDFRYVVPSEYVHEDMTGKTEVFSSGGGYWHSVKWIDQDHYYTICNEWDGTLMLFDAREDRENGCEYDETGFYGIIKETPLEDLMLGSQEELNIFWELHDALVKTLTDLGYPVDYFDVMRKEEE